MTDFTQEDLDSAYNTINGKQNAVTAATVRANLAGAVNTISPSFISYLDHGGLGLAIGDGKLPHPGSEGIVECFYKWALSDDTHVTLDYQLVVNPAYNRDRGPVSVFALRIHAAL